MTAIQPIKFAPKTTLPPDVYARLSGEVTTFSRSTLDEWQCYSETIEPYFQPPGATGALDEALWQYKKLLNDQQNCTLPPPTRETPLPECPWQGQSAWCDFTKFAPSTVLPAYTEYSTSASSWWVAHSSGVSSLSMYCPNRWKHVASFFPYSESKLNHSKALAGCGAEMMDPVEASQTGSPTTGFNQKTGGTVEETVQSAPKATASSNGASSLKKIAALWLAAVCLAIVGVN